MTFSGRYILNIIWFAAQQGADPKALLALTGKSEAALKEEGLRLPAEVYNRLIHEALRLTRNPCFGLHVGESMSLAAAGIITQLVQSSRTVKEALELCCEFAALGCQALPMQLIEESEFYKLQLKPDPFWLLQFPEVVKQTADAVAVFAIREFQALTRHVHRPIGFHTIFNKPEKPGEYERILKCPLRFQQEEIALFLGKQHVEERVVSSDYQLLRLLVTHAQERIVSLKKERSFSSTAQQAILNLKEPGLPSIQQVAAQLNMSTRSFQRKLQEENTSFKEVLEELRKQSAFNYLKNPDLSVKEIAYLLDYADAASFSRSFKRWTGKTPVEFRDTPGDELPGGHPHGLNDPSLLK